MPDVDAINEHLIAYLFEAGPDTGGNPLTWGELVSWQHMTGVQLTEYEAGALRELSRVYLSQYHEAEAANCPPPYIHVEALPSRAEVSRRVGEALRSMSKGRRK